MELLAEPNNPFGSVRQSVGNKVAVARFDEGLGEIIFAICRRLRIVPPSFANINNPRTVELLHRVKASIEASQADDDFENGAGMIIFLRGAIELRPRNFIGE